MKNFCAKFYSMPPFRSLLTRGRYATGFATATRRCSIFAILTFFSMLFTSCLPQISIKAGKDDEASIFFSTGFSDSTAKILKNLTGLEANDPLFNKDDILVFLKSAGAENTSANIPTQNEIATTGTIPHISKNKLFTSGLLEKTENELSLSLGTKQIVAFYSLLSEEAKSYLDLMMIPALLGEKMSVEEYKELLSSMYGPSFAKEIVDGKLTIVLSSPDGRKQIKETISLGELLCMTEEKTWTVKF